MRLLYAALANPRSLLASQIKSIWDTPPPKKKATREKTEADGIEGQIGNMASVLPDGDIHSKGCSGITDTNAIPKVCQNQISHFVFRIGPVRGHAFCFLFCYI